MKYDDWPVARRIERGRSRLLLLTRYRGWVARPGEAGRGAGTLLGN